MTRPTSVTCKRCGNDFAPKHDRGRLPETCYDCKDQDKAANLAKMRETYDPRYVPTATPDGKIIPPGEPTPGEALREKLDLDQPPYGQGSTVAIDQDVLDRAAAHPTSLGKTETHDWAHDTDGNLVGSEEPPTSNPARGKVETEPTWLDAPEIQEQVAEKNASNQSGGTIDEDVDYSQPLPIEFVDGDTMLRDLGVHPDQERKPRPEPVISETVRAKFRELGATDDDIDEAEQKIARDRAGEKTCIARSCQIPDPTHVDRFCTNHWRLIDLDTRGVLLGAPRDSGPFNKALSKALRQLR